MQRYMNNNFSCSVVAGGFREGNCLRQVICRLRHTRSGWTLLHVCDVSTGQGNAPLHRKISSSLSDQMCMEQLTWKESNWLAYFWKRLPKEEAEEEVEVPRTGSSAFTHIAPVAAVAADCECLLRIPWGQACIRTPEAKPVSSGGHYKYGNAIKFQFWFDWER